MKQDSGATKSVWLQSANFPATDSLDETHIDICVIGAGISGLSCAYQLCMDGRAVVVLDDGPIAGGETCRTTAHLASALDDRFVEIERLHGRDGSRLAYESHAAAIDRIEQIVEAENIDCEFQRVDGFLFAGENYSAEDMRKEYEAAERAGFTGAMYPAKLPYEDAVTTDCIRFPRQAQFDPIKYLAGVAAAIRKAGGKIVSNQFVTVVEEKDGVAKITLDGGRVLTADFCVVATNAPIVSLEMQLKQAPYRSYAIAAEVPTGSVPAGLYWDTEDPYHYVRLQHGNEQSDSETDLLIVGGEDHKTGMDHDPAHRFGALYAWAKFRFPQLGAVKFQWSGQVMEPADALAFIGRAPGFKNVFVSTGDSGMGMTHGTIAGMLIPDLVHGKSNRWESLYDPSRRTMGGLPTFVKENLTAVPQLLAAVLPGDVNSINDIEPGSGAVIREGLNKVAVHRTDTGKLQKVSAVCTHLGCEVEWNHLEKTWDCPCHGSRFQTDGKVLNGPATDPLKSVDAEK